MTTEWVIAFVTVCIFLVIFWIALWTDGVGCWRGYVDALLFPEGSESLSLDRYVEIRSKVWLAGFRLWDVLPGRIPLVQVQEQFDSGQERSLPFTLEAGRVAGRPYVDVVLSHSAGQGSESGLHHVTLVVRKNDLPVEPAKFSVVWQPIDVMV